MAVHDQSDYEGLEPLSDELRKAEALTAELENRWLELSEVID